MRTASHPLLKILLYSDKEERMIFDFIQTAGHGYLEVPMEVFKEHGGTRSKFSPKSATHVYLEEDCDAPEFCDLLDEKGVAYTIRQSTQTNNERNQAEQYIESLFFYTALTGGA
jgi:hypothetical protein